MAAADEEADTTTLALAPSAARPAVRLNNALVNSLAVGKVYRDHKGTISGLDFTQDGMHLVTAGDDNNVYIYNCEKASRSRHLRCEKLGVSLIKFLHNDRDAAVCSSRVSQDNVLKYWDFHENKYLRLFRSHTGKLRSVSPHPYEDIFISGAADKLVLLWDLRQDRPVAKINGEGPTVASFDQQGLVFAASVGQPRLHLFDTRNYAKGEFVCFDISAHLRGSDKLVHSVQFSPCGKYLLVRSMHQLLLIDAFDGELVCEYDLLAGNAQEPVAKRARGEADAPPPMPCFSPDSQYVMSGVQGGDVCVWSTANAKLVHQMVGHTVTPSSVLFNPTHALAVTAAETLAWWIPDMRKAGAAGLLSSKSS
eukprot:TRINITY_DN75588_c0_g1_i1.p1 TRINITY_DN75588_c0_g1~~TRINITY_DN75588_c0_g1_i1.p1  ORF type:complete len:365 (+),score=92.50 TRINITY_DN75588_c0_g1_i1:98-1192(+)